MSDQDGYQRACEKYAVRCAEMRAEEEELQELQAPLAQQRQRSSEALVYKTFETPAPQPRQEDQWAGWNAWADSRITKYIEDTKMREAIGEAIGLLLHELKEHTEQKIGSLRAGIEILRGVIKSQNVGIITRGKDVA